MSLPPFAKQLACLLGLALALSLNTPSAPGQSVHLRATVPSAQALGMGGAATAYATPQTAIFFNPAQLTRLRITRAPITLLGATASFSQNLTEHLDFFHDHVEPAIDTGLEGLSKAEEDALYDGLFRLGRSPSLVNGTVMLPSFAFNRGHFGLGGGFFLRSSARYFVEDAGGGIPSVDFSILTDAMVVASTAYDFSKIGLRGLSLGLTGRYNQRFVTLKDKPIDAFLDDESLYVLNGGSAALDLGVLYEVPVLPGPGRLFAGATAYNLLDTDYDFAFLTYVEKREERRNDTLIENEIALAESRYQPISGYRMGLAYVLPHLAGPLRETAFALDVTHFEHEVNDAFLSRLNMGVQTSLGRHVFLRSGLNQGYTTVGFGFQLPFVQIDYAFYGLEQGRLPGQNPSWRHRVQFLLGSF